MEKELSLRVNPDVLRWARTSLTVSRADAAKRTGMDLERIEQLEKGEQEPTLGELEKMAKAYRRTLATLLLAAPPFEKPFPEDRRTQNSAEIGSLDEKTIMAIRKSRAFVQSLITLRQEAELPIIVFNHRATIQSVPTEVAADLRALWQLDEVRQVRDIHQALDAYINKIEAIGVAVFQLSLKDERLRGFALVDEPMPVIGIKRNDTPTAKTFTLFHELAHIILNEGGISDSSLEANNQQVEKWCNAFAGEILIPQRDLLATEIVKTYMTKQDTQWAKKDLVELGNYFHVGPLAILRRLLALQLTTTDFYKQKHIAWHKPIFVRAKNPKGRDIAQEVIREKGRQYVGLAFKAFDQNRIDIKDLSDFLGVKMAYITKTRQHLNT